jgi:peptidyl-prolyl cis-trans isomerase C
MPSFPNYSARSRFAFTGSLVIVLFWAFSLQTRAAGKQLFADPVVAKGKGIEIRESDLDEAFIGFKAARAAMGQSMPPFPEKAVREQVLEKLIATKLLLSKATGADLDEGKRTAERLLAQARTNSPSEAAFRRQLVAMGTTPEKYEAEITEQAVVKAVIDRELKNRQIITDAEVKKFYDENLSAFQEPEKARVAHILFTTRKIPTGEELPSAEQEQKRRKAKALLEKLKNSKEDFIKLIPVYTEEPETPGQKRGELVITKGGRTVPPSFEVAAFSLQPGKISDVVESPFGYHIIKLIEKIPPATTPLDKVAEQIRSRLQEKVAQEKLPEYLKKAREEAKVEILSKDV